MSAARKRHFDLGETIRQDLAPEPSPPAEPAPAVEAGTAPEAMTLDEIAATPRGERRQFNIGVPRKLALHRRAAMYREDHGVDRQDQAAAALDAWLRERGY